MDLRGRIAGLSLDERVLERSKVFQAFGEPHDTYQSAQDVGFAH